MVYVGHGNVGNVGSVGNGNGFHGGITSGGSGTGGTSGRGIGWPGCTPGGTTGAFLIAGPWFVWTIRGLAVSADCGDTTATGNATGSGACGTSGR